MDNNRKPLLSSTNVIVAVIAYALLTAFGGAAFGSVVTKTVVYALCAYGGYRVYGATDSALIGLGVAIGIPYFLSISGLFDTIVSSGAALSSMVQKTLWFGVIGLGAYYAYRLYHAVMGRE